MSNFHLSAGPYVPRDRVFVPLSLGLDRLDEVSLPDQALESNLRFLTWCVLIVRVGTWHVVARDKYIANTHVATALGFVLPSAPPRPVANTSSVSSQ